jgi:hypothetical protein
VSLGYDIQRKKIESLLTQAAERAELKDPFVQILELGDFSVKYRVAGFLSEVKHLITARSRLHMTMLDSLHEGGVEIVSPTFMTQRQIREGQSFIPLVRREEPLVSHVPDGEKEIPEALMFDKAEEAQSIDQARLQMKLVVDKIAEIEKALNEATDETLKARLEATLDVLEQQRGHFEERLERMIVAAEQLKTKG